MRLILCLLLVLPFCALGVRALGWDDVGPIMDGYDELKDNLDDLFSFNEFYKACLSNGGTNCAAQASICFLADKLMGSKIGGVIPLEMIVPPVLNPYCLGKPTLKCCLTDRKNGGRGCHSAFNRPAPINCEGNPHYGNPDTAGPCLRVCHANGYCAGCTCDYLPECRGGADGTTTVGFASNTTFVPPSDDELDEEMETLLREMAGELVEMASPSAVNAPATTRILPDADQRNPRDMARRDALFKKLSRRATGLFWRVGPHVENNTSCNSECRDKRDAAGAWPEDLSRFNARSEVFGMTTWRGCRSRDVILREQGPFATLGDLVVKRRRGATISGGESDVYRTGLIMTWLLASRVVGAIPNFHERYQYHARRAYSVADRQAWIERIETLAKEVDCSGENADKPWCAPDLKGAEVLMLHYMSPLLLKLLKASYSNWELLAAPLEDEDGPFDFKNYADEVPDEEDRRRIFDGCVMGLPARFSQFEASWTEGGSLSLKLTVDDPERAVSVENRTAESGASTMWIDWGDNQVESIELGADGSQDTQLQTTLTHQYDASAGRKWLIKVWYSGTAGLYVRAERVVSVDVPGFTTIADLPTNDDDSTSLSPIMEVGLRVVGKGQRFDAGRVHLLVEASSSRDDPDDFVKIGAYSYNNIPAGYRGATYTDQGLVRFRIPTYMPVKRLRVRAKTYKYYVYARAYLLFPYVELTPYRSSGFTWQPPARISTTECANKVILWDGLSPGGEIINQWEPKRDTGFQSDDPADGSGSIIQFTASRRGNVREDNDSWMTINLPEEMLPTVAKGMAPDELDEKYVPGFFKQWQEVRPNMFVEVK